MGFVNFFNKAKLSGLLSNAVAHPEELKKSDTWAAIFETAWNVREIRDKVIIMLSKISGYKTYIVAALTGLVTALHYMGKIDDATFQMLLGLLGAGGLAAVRSALSKVSV